VTLLGLDTSTSAASAAVLRDDGEAFEVTPAPERLGRPPAHASELMPAVAEVMERAEVGYGDLEAIAVGVGPGTFTGLRIGIATARALATAAALPLRAVSSLAALAEGITPPYDDAGRPAAGQHANAGSEPAAEPTGALLRLPLIDARRGEVFAALFEGGRELWPPFAATPDELVARLRQGGFTPLAAGDGSLRFRGMLEEAGISVLAQESEAHVVSARHICRLGLAGRDEPPEAVLPEYLREPDARPQQ
jgi:tRNA threonylcarbamoyladenosine biosynthesis protein TsaB